MPKQNFDGLIEITLLGSNHSSQAPDKDGDVINLSIKSPVSSTVHSLKKVWSEYSASSEELCCVFDGFLLEDNATLVGLGVVGGDSVLVFPKGDGLGQLADIQLKKRSAEEISVGLNVLIGEDEGLEVLEVLEVLGQSNSFQESGGPVFSKKMSLFNSDDTLVKLVESKSLDMDKLRQRFVRLVYDREFCVEKEDIDYLLSHQDNIDNLNECKQEIFEAVKNFWLVHYQLPGDSSVIDYDTVFIGPERNANFSNYLAFPPTVQLRGVTWNTSLRDLLESYQEYSGCNINTSDCLLFNNESYSLEEKVYDVYTESLSRLPYLPSHQHFSFSFDISNTEDLRCVDDLVNFIEGSDDINLEGRKRKKKRKKKGQNEESKEPTSNVMEVNERNIQQTESRMKSLEVDTEIIETTMKEETLKEISQNIVNEIGERNISFARLEDLKKQFEVQIEQEKRNLEKNDLEEKRLLALRERDARLILHIRQVDLDISNISNGISSCDSEIHDLEMRLKRCLCLKEKLSERQNEKMKKIRLLEEEKRSLTQSINTEAARCFDERTKTYNRIEELKKKLLSAIKDIEQFDSSKDDSIPQSVEKVTGNHLKPGQREGET